MDDKSLTRRIINLRHSKNWTQAELAKHIGIERSRMNKIENGTRKVTPEEISKFAQLFDVTADFLLGNTNLKREYSLLKTTENDLNMTLDRATSFDGEPVTEHDREVIRTFLKGWFGDRASK